MGKLDELMNIPGVVGAGRWKPADTVAGKPPELLETVGAIQGDDALVAMTYLEADGITAAAQAFLWDKLGTSGIKMSPVKGIAVMGPTHSFCATDNRVGVCLDNSAQVDMWALAQKMLSV